MLWSLPSLPSCVLALAVAATSAAEVFVFDRLSGAQVAAFRAASAGFGRPLPDRGLRGLAFKVRPSIYACQEIDPPPPHIVRQNAIAIVARFGGCNFEKKVSWAQRANYSAVIVYNNHSDKLVPMGGDDDKLIPSVFIGYTDAQILLDRYVDNDSYQLLLTDDDSFDVNAYLLPFAIVVGICFLVMLCVVLFKCWQDHRRSKRHRLPKSALRRLPIIKFKVGDPYETCCVCLDDFVVGEKLRILPCDHGYHAKCIDPWLVKNKRICPQCRKKVFPSPEDDHSDEEENAPLLANAAPIAAVVQPPAHRAQRQRPTSTPSPPDSPSPRERVEALVEREMEAAIQQHPPRPSHQQRVTALVVDEIAAIVHQHISQQSDSDESEEEQGIAV